MRQAALDAAESVIRRHGVDRMRIVDVAKLVGVNHAILYRHFTDRADLIDAVSLRWLTKLQKKLEAITAADGDPDVRLKQWFATLYALLREKRTADPDLYRSFRLAADENRPFVGKHVAAIRWQVAKLVTEAMQTGQYRDSNPLETATVLFEATTAFHHPALIDDQAAADRQDILALLLEMLTAGLRVTGRN